MTRFPTLEGKEIISVLEANGFDVVRRRGSHTFLKHPDGRATVVPLHAGETVGPGLFTKILRDVQMTRVDFLKDRKGHR